MFISEQSGKGPSFNSAEAQRVAELLSVQALIAREAALSVVTPAVEGVLTTIDATAGQIGRVLAKNRLTRSLMLLIFGAGVVEACMAANPQKTGSLDPEIVTQPAAVVETAIPATKVPTPEVGVDRATVSPKEYAGEQLKEKLKEYNRVPLSSYNEKGEAIIWGEKPTGRAAFDIKQDEFTLAFGVNNEAWLVIKDGERNVVMDYGNLVDLKTGLPIENMFAYSIYLDPDTKQITDKITDKSLKVPVISVIKGVNGQPDKWIYLDWHDPILSDEDFYDIVASNKKVDGLMALVAPETLADVLAAPDFIKKIKFKGDWQVLFDEEGGLVMIDVATKEEIASFDGENWLEVAPSADDVWTEVATKWKLTPEDYTKVVTPDGTTVWYDPATQKPVFVVGQGVATATGETLQFSGHFELEFAKDMIANSGMCFKTEWTPGAAGVPSGDDYDSWWNTFSLPLWRALKNEMQKPNNDIEFSGNTPYDLYVGGPNKCWVEVMVKSPKGGTKETPKSTVFGFDINKKLFYVRVYDGQYVEISATD